MRSAARAVAVVALLGFVSCTSSTEPNVHLAEITDIEVPQMVDLTDPIVIGFSYSFGGCDRLERVQAEQREGELMFAVWIRRSSGLHCPDVLFQRSVQYSLLPLAPLPLTVKFRQPTGDVVYTVAALAAQLTQPAAAP